MDENIHNIASWCAQLIELIGIAILTGVALFTVVYAVWLIIRHKSVDAVFHYIRQSLGRGILVGLEFLVAADIIYTVAVELTWETLGGLAIVVLIRTFLSFTIELELTGSWHWQPGTARDKRHRSEQDREESDEVVRRQEKDSSSKEQSEVKK